MSTFLLSIIFAFINFCSTQSLLFHLYYKRLNWLQHKLGPCTTIFCGILLCVLPNPFVMCVFIVPIGTKSQIVIISIIAKVKRGNIFKVEDLDRVDMRTHVQSTAVMTPHHYNTSVFSCVLRSPLLSSFSTLHLYQTLGRFINSPNGKFLCRLHLCSVTNYKYKYNNSL